MFSFAVRPRMQTPSRNCSRARERESARARASENENESERASERERERVSLHHTAQRDTPLCNPGREGGGVVPLLWGNARGG